MNRDIKQLVSQMTLEEKAGMCSGKDFWHLKGVERLGIPSVMVSDGPHGLRKQEDNADHLGINQSIKAVCFPSACATAASFDRELIYKMGEALGQECQAENVSVLLGPAVNIKRSPLCGRNFEYFSEDPYLSTEMATHHILGVQSQNVGTSMKHFAANNQEYRRMTSSSEVDERTLREIYLASFEGAVKHAKPWTIMCSYNRVNGVFASEHTRLLTEILRDEWGFDGYVVSDWGAVNDRVEGLRAGLELEMPSCNGVTDLEIIAAVSDGRLDVAVLDTAVERLLTVIFKFNDQRIEGEFSREHHHELAVKIEEECIVLLKNEEILPLNPNQKAAFIGEFAQKPRFQGGGSSHINASIIESALDSISGKMDVTFASGYTTVEDIVDEALILEAVNVAQAAQVAVLFIGLPDSFESEGYDRKHLRLPDCQNKLVEAVCAVQPNTVVVLHNGSPVEMPWVDSVKAIVEVYLGGEGVGRATVNVLLGSVNPSGKLAETFPLKLEDNPSYLNFPGTKDVVEYREGVFVGYRYYDTKKQPVLFPFGHGLSYTTFAFDNLLLSHESLLDSETLQVSVDVTNTGTRAGKEVVQVYVKDHTNVTMRPEKELRNFAKVKLLPGETKTVTLTLDKRAFAYFNTDINDWYCATGVYEVMIGQSSQNIVLSKNVTVISSTVLPMVVTPNTTVGDLMRDPRTAAYVQRLFPKPTMNGNPDEAISEAMIAAMVENFPLRAARGFAGVTNEQLNEMIAMLNQVLGN